MHPTDHQALIEDIKHAAFVTGGGLILFYLLFFILKRWSKSQKHFIPNLLEKHLHLPGVILFIVISLNINLAIFDSFLRPNVYVTLQHLLRVLLIIAISFLLLRIVSFLRDLLIGLYARHEYKDYTMRSVRTKFQLIHRVINIVILIGTIAVLLMTFRQGRQIGNTLLASAGVAGIVLAFAAQKSLGSLFAGIQIAITQPVKIDDTVVVNGQFGTVGEISLTYAVINTWDGKRLIVPINYFLENPVENWTRVSPEVVGKVKIYTDYTLPVEALRPVFKSWLEETPLWDKRKSALLITAADDKTMEVRATMSAKDSDDAFDLECMIREKLITYVREHYPQCLPLARLTIQNARTDENGKET